MIIIPIRKISIELLQKKYTINSRRIIFSYLEKRGLLSENSTKNKFWLVTEATKYSELIDVITLVYSQSIFRIARGSDVKNDHLVEIFPYNGEEALELAKSRIENKGILY